MKDRKTRPAPIQRFVNTGPRRRWTSPPVVEYGHLAKLTRGSSGTHVETVGMKKTCL